MRLHRLELEGFGPFRDRQVVDFDAYADDGIFLISGRTGAGKSSILDGVCFALYGGVPRYGTGEKRLRSDHAAADDPTEVSLELTVAGRRLRVTRSPQYERAKRRGAGTTPIPARAALDELVDGEWRNLAARPGDVGVLLHDILGLTQEQFLQVVLLAQNRFAEFLLAKPDDRRDVLETLFGTRRYREYALQMDERRKAAEADIALRAEGVRRLVDEILRAGEIVPTGDDLDAALEAAALAVARADYRVEASDVARTAAATAFDDAEREHRALTELAERLASRARSRAALAALEERDGLVAADRAQLAAALDAEELRAALTDADRAGSAAARASLLLMAARGDLADPSDADDPTALVDELAELLASWRAALVREEELAELDRRHDGAAARLASQVAAADELSVQRAAIPERVAVLDARLAVDRILAGGADAAAAAVTALEGRAAAAADAQRLAAERDRAEAVQAGALAESAAAIAAMTALLRRRLAGHAAELAADLVEGEPCLVCGATAHPHPAAAADEPVTDDDLADADARRERASTAESAAAETARRAREQHATAAEHAGGASADELGEQLARARHDLTAAASAARRVAADDVERAALIALGAEIDRECAAAALEIAVRRDELTRLDERRDVGRAAIVAARGDHASVGERIAATERRRDAVRALIEADAEAARRADTAAAAASALDAAVAGSPFADADEARDALLERDVRTALAEAVAAHETAVRVERERLLALELELADAPEGSVDLVGAVARRQAARDAWTDAIGEATRAVQDAKRLRDLLERATEGHAGIAELARDAAVVGRLAHTLAGRAPNTHRMDLETFVLAAELEEIVQSANLRLAEMSSGRFQLAHTDALAARGAASGLGLEVVDAFSGSARPTASLSGGERFLASLALALGLAEVVTARAGGMRLDTLFVDEGFGSLDGDTLELAMRALDELRQGGRTVGVISHVEAMKEQLTAQLQVEALPGGPSVVRQDVRVAG